MFCKDRGPEHTGNRSFHWQKFIATVFATFILGGAWFMTRLVLVIIPEGDKAPHVFATEKGDTWHISLTHSVQKTPWEEYFRVDGAGELTLTHTVLSSFGWGYPYDEADGKLTHRADNRYELLMNRRLGYVPLRISSQARQHFHHGDTDLDFVRLYGEGTKMDIRVMHRYEYLLKKLR